ncbi:cardiolipin synthase [Halalkalibacter akibai]|uniref:Cardiolipin synthase n=1 Tax=Halalkalibacter akibai (strain ATCC 43226 / DSM 21942 / CIP 109018 / JCM 9157 / 1139) TaxID=1236973 RepID=W4QXT9_HALA3|nr:cardiolipin synthase [Halalkalibacter akibai]GAE36149.1 cardiolipin synthetase [Halalkalibacter akibai JCM 9157]
MSITTVIISIVFILNTALILTIIFLERRNVNSIWTWALVLTLLPVVGFLLYIIFGRNLSRSKLFRWDKESYELVKKVVSNQINQLNDHSYKMEDPVISKYRDFILMNLSHSASLLTENNQVTVYTKGADKFDSLLSDIKQAKSHIHILYYIIRDDELGNKIADALASKAKEGVEVRLLYDDLGSRRLSKTFIEKVKSAGGEIEAFFPSRIPFINLTLNFRNHRKLVVIDGETGYIGGFNVGDEYLGLNQRFGYWRDTHLKIKGEAVNHIQTRFIQDWNQASKKEITIKEYLYPFTKQYGKFGIQIVSSGPDSQLEQIKKAYIKMILKAKKYVYIQTPYFIPDESLLDALKIACFSGLDVRIMIPNKPDHPFVYWATYSNIGELLKIGAKIYIYDNGFLHCKTIVADDEIASIGTANIDVRSFRLNFEVNAFLYSSKDVKPLTEIFHEDMKHSRELTKEDYNKRSLKIRFKESVSRLLSPIL